MLGNLRQCSGRGDLGTRRCVQRSTTDHQPTLRATLTLSILLQAEWLSRNGLGDQAEKLLNDGRLHHHDPRFLLKLGELHQKNGQEDLAQESWTKASQELRHHLLGHERDLALVLFYLSPEDNDSEIRKLIAQELERRQDAETLRIRDLVLPEVSHQDNPPH